MSLNILQLTIQRHLDSNIISGDPKVDKFWENRFSDENSKRSKIYVCEYNNIPVGFVAIANSSWYGKFYEYEKKQKWPMVLLAQLGVDQKWQKKGIGRELVSFVIRETENLMNRIGIRGIVLVTYNPDLVDGFYNHFGFKVVENRNNRIVMVKDMHDIATAE